VNVVALAPGARLGVYRITAPLGEGGMAQVYRAIDTTLDRQVAIKILPEASASDPDRLARFGREAKALAALNHPNIAAIYAVEKTADTYALVMELVEGEDLSQRLARGPMPLGDALAIAAQIADALEAAHGQGIVHRDLKPANVRITPAGQAKVLDLGLAKVMAEGGPTADQDARTTTSDGTRVGMILGTAAYMSPEQARGMPVDRRADVWAFGCVLYEMLAGRAAFARATLADTLAAVIGQAPRWDALPSATPEAVVALLQRCLDKDPGMRPGDMGSVRRAIDAAGAGRRDAGHAPMITSGRGSKGRRWAIVAVALCLAGWGAWLLSTRRAQPALTDKDTIVIADFANTTGDPVFDGTLRLGLSVQLEQSPFLSIVPDEQIQQVLQMMGRKPDAKLAGASAREVCQRTGSAAVLEGSISQIGAQYDLILKAVECTTGASLASTDARAADKSHVLDALGSAAAAIRTKLGESLRTVQQFDTPLQQATTPSLEALQAFSSGVKVLSGPGGSPAAIPFFRRAIELDPKFAIAYAMLGRVSIDVGDATEATDATRRAYRLRDRASEWERYFIAAAYDLLVTGDLQKAEETCQLWIAAYPRAVDARNITAGPVYLQLGRYEKTVEQAEEAVTSHPDLPIAYAHLLIAYTALNRLDDAKGAYRRALARHIDSSFTDFAVYAMDFLEGDAAGMAALVAGAKGKPGIEDVFVASEALTSAYSGQLRKARDLFRQAVGSAERMGHQEERAGYVAAEALIEGLFGNAAEARQGAATALDASRGRDNQYAAALALGLAGDGSSAQRLEEDLGSRFPEDTVAQFNYLPTLRAEAALARNEANDAIDVLRAATPCRVCSSFSRAIRSTFGGRPFWPPTAPPRPRPNSRRFSITLESS
jgi:tetratricopeptide (TPR) repeat protein